MSVGELLRYGGLKQFDLNLVERQSASNSRDGSGYVVEQGQPYWMLSVRYEGMNDADWGELEAWISRRRQSLISFTAYAPQFKQPRTMDGVDNSNLSMTVNGAGNVVISKPELALSSGDLIGFFTQSGGYYLGRALEGRIGSGEVEVIPKAPTPHSSSPNPRIVQALGEFQLVGLPQKTDPYDKRRSLSFEAKQVVRL